jgi:hypothetical protein
LYSAQFQGSIEVESLVLIAHPSTPWKLTMAEPERKVLNSLIRLDHLC